MVIIPANNQEYDSLLKLSARAFGNALMRITGEKPGIVEVLNQDVLTSRLKRGILDLPVKTSDGLCIEFEFHSGPIEEDIVIRNYQYAIDLRGDVGVPVKPHFVSLDANKTPVPKVELFPGVFTKPEVTYFADICGEKVINTIKEKLNKQVELDEMDAYYLALIPFFRNEKNRAEMLDDMCQFINKIKISEDLKYIIKLIQILSASALCVGDKQEEILGVIKMGSSYIANYEKNLIRENNLKIAQKMKELGATAEFIFKCTGIKL